MLVFRLALLGPIGIAPANIRFAGRWFSDKSMMVYLQEAEAAFIMLSLSASQLLKLEAYEEFNHFVSAPSSRTFVDFVVLQASRAQNGP